MSDVPFHVIGSDHGIEHENWALKVIGRIGCLTSNTGALKRFFLAASEVNSRVIEFKNRYEIDLSKNIQDHRHQISNATNKSFTKEANESENKAEYNESFHKVDGKKSLF